MSVFSEELNKLLIRFDMSNEELWEKVAGRKNEE